jgi:hypothetical protein
MAELFRKSVPEPARFIISGAVGSLAFWALNEVFVMYYPFEYQSITVCFFLAYLVSIWMQHLLHSTLVYGWVQSYWAGLVSTYTGYSLALVLSTPINYGLVNFVKLDAGGAWLGTLIITGIGNYFLLGFLMGDKKGSKKVAQSKQ